MSLFRKNVNLYKYKNETKLKQKKNGMKTETRWDVCVVCGGECVLSSDCE